MKWIPDEEFIRGKIPMTKFNVRILTIGYLGIKEGDRFLDIGAGTGSVSIEAALQGAKVWAIEKESVGTQLIKKNSDKFKVGINIIEGKAPDNLPDIRIDKCFIGGSGNKLNEIFQDVMKKQYDKLDPVRSTFGKIEKEEATVEDKIEYLSDYVKSHQKFRFRDLLTAQKSRLQVVVTFLAILELMKTGTIYVEQEETFDEILITSNV